MKVPGLSFDPDHPDLAWRETRVAGVAWIPLHLEAVDGPAADGPAPDRQARDREAREGAPGREPAGSGERPGDATVLIRMEPGHGYPAHLHLGPEEVLVLSGGYRDDRGEHRAGDHVRYPAGSRHAPVALGDASRAAGPGNPACVLYAVAQRGVRLLDGPAGAPRTGRGEPAAEGPGAPAPGE